MSQTLSQRMALRSHAEKLAHAKTLLGPRWLLHPANKIKRKTPFQWKHPMEAQS